MRLYVCFKLTFNSSQLDGWLKHWRLAISINASEMFRAMWNACTYSRQRQTDSLVQPNATIEAPPGSTFQLRSMDHNIVDCRPLDMRWAWANTLHFFSGSEHAEMLAKYNPIANRFVSNGIWRGAYGAICMPQILKCVELLREQPHTRRAIVSLGGYCEDPDANRPACISFMHFLQCSEGLCMSVYQRSLNLWGVMPYDCILLTNILHYVAKHTGLPCGTLSWTIGSLHIPLPAPVPEYSGIRNTGLLIDVPPDPLDVLRKEASNARTLAEAG